MAFQRKTKTAEIDCCRNRMKHGKKNMLQGPKLLFATFVNLKAGFASISRLQLWTSLESSSINRWLFLLLRSLHDNTHLWVGLNRKWNLSDPINTYKGVRQGCSLAPFLLNFYINGIVSHLDSSFKASRTPCFYHFACGWCPPPTYNTCWPLESSQEISDFWHKEGIRNSLSKDQNYGLQQCTKRRTWTLNEYSL